MNIREIQSILTQIGIDVGKIDGINGVKTNSGIKQFQKMFGLQIDGIVGSKTIAVLNKAKDIKHFKVGEFACRHCKEIKLDIELLLKLEELRTSLGNKAILVNSGYRCPVHNVNVGGAKNSLHLQGKAADIRVNGVTPMMVRNAADKIFVIDGVGVYDTFVHVDTRSYKHRFDYRTKK